MARTVMTIAIQLLSLYGYGNLAMLPFSIPIAGVLLVVEACIAVLATLLTYLVCLTIAIVWSLVNWTLRRPESHDLYLLHLQRNLYW